MIRAVFSLSNAIGLDLIVEGVETKAQLDFLQMLGCPMYQGYFFSKPLPAKSIPDFLSTAAKLGHIK